MDYIAIKTKLQNYTVGIAGAGGLGSNCAAALVRVGIGKLIIADFDVIEESNLNRQFYFRDQLGEKKVLALRQNLERINPDVELEMHDCKLGHDEIISIYHSCDVIVEAFDKAEMKQMIIDTVLTEFPEKSLVVGLGLAGFGQSNSIRLHQNGKMYICGDRQTETSTTWPPIAPRVGMVAHMQANTVLEILLNK